ncbi:STM4015 family protein [Marinactinospora thermotolerans]|uniref:Cytoplasmic protein n=1 Tax=Marinactinospora thermotolerans DSM 45154 TaxID=1122192 RepID=A0A1T4TC06_9ACTN|nr:STM4015 family protein [Marinactinospora thermotolerans]SKA38022.1 hypothetical protein SAMN02745673_04776 [Marinactinospora thermotolerans DSM 45154]
MDIYDKITEFGGLPVVDLPPDGPLPEAVADPGAVAWRLDVDPWDDRYPKFPLHFARFLEVVDTTRVTALVIGTWGEGYEDSGSVPRDLLVEHAARFPALRALFFGEFTMELTEISWIEQTDVTPLLAAFPGLRELVVRGSTSLEFPATRHGELRSLVFQTGGLPAEVVRGVLGSDLPALEHLEMWFGSEYYGGSSTVADLAPLLDAEPFPRLSRLGLRNAEWTDELVARLADAAVTGRVPDLDLSLGTLTDTGGRVLLEAPVFRGLRRLDLHHHFLSEEMEDRLREAFTAAGVEIDLSEREQPDVYDGQVHYYPEVTE